MQDAPDITDKKVYSIEEYKLKQEQDDRVKAGEEKKNEVRQQVELLREEFKTILSKNASLPAGQS